MMVMVVNGSFLKHSLNAVSTVDAGQASNEDFKGSPLEGRRIQPSGLKSLPILWFHRGVSIN